MESHIRRNAVVRERVVLGGVTYEVAVLQDDEGCLARWNCPICDQSDQPRVKLAGKAAAVEWARNSLTAHHESFHANA
jgi:hypothetical protein